MSGLPVRISGPRDLTNRAPPGDTAEPPVWLNLPRPSSPSRRETVHIWPGHKSVRLLHAGCKVLNTFRT
ncbi:MAG: hypothetical protein ACK55Z_05400, partial [bacterium]